MYSTITKKKCKCGCDKYPTMSCFGYNYNCLPDDLKEKAGTKKKVQIRNKNRRINIAYKLKKHQRELIGETDLQLWFKYQMWKNPKVCENCGASLEHYSEWEWHGSQHHCLEKSLFPTVAAHPDNILVLGYYCCHSQFHSSMLNASKMKIFPKAKEIVIKLYPELTIEEQRKISEYYGILD